MKKFLSLVLALVMTMSLVTISAGAEDFTDDSKITYGEAVDVMTAVGVVGGYADGSFNPTAGLTRGAAAKIICNMILGPTTAEALSANDAPFKDVAVDNVFAGYIAYCVNEGIISGYADGTFRPAAPLTGYAFMKMLLGALGYDAAIEGYTGANWSIQVAKRALAIGLDDGLVSDFSGAKALTREEACLYAFNAMNTKMVEYNQKSTISVGDLVITQNSDAKEINKLFRAEYFTNLKVGAPTADDFGRPATTWYVGKAQTTDNTVGTYAAEADYTVVINKDYNTLTTLVDYVMDEVDALADDAADKAINAGNTYLNGANIASLVALNNKVTDPAFNTTGLVIELFMEEDSTDIDTIVGYAYTLAEITKVDTKVSAADAKKDITAYITFDGTEYDDVDVAGFDAETYVEDAYAAIIVNGGKVIASYIPDSVKGVVSAQKTGEFVKVDGVKYAYTGTATPITCNYEDDYVVYVDENGYALGVVGASFVAIEDVFYVTDVYTKQDAKTGTYTYLAETVSLTGEVAEIEVGVADASEGGALYVVDWDKTNKVYTLTAYTNGTDTTYDVYTGNVAADTNIKASAKSITLNTGKVYVEDDTKFVSIKTKSASGTWVDEVAVAEGGMALSYAAGNTIIALYDENKDAGYVLYVGTGVDTVVNTENVVFMTANSSETNSLGTVSTVYFMDDVKAGTKEITTDAGYDVGFYTYSIDEDGVYSLTQTKLYNKTVDKEVTGGSTLVLTSYHNDVFTGSNSGTVVTATDFSVEGAEIVDLRDADTVAADAYDREITSFAALKNAIDAAGTTVCAQVYFVDGVATLVAVYAV